MSNKPIDLAEIRAKAEKAKQRSRQGAVDPAGQTITPSPVPPGAVTAEIVDRAPAEIRRPLALVEGRAYAAAWLNVRTTVRTAVDKKTGKLEVLDPPEVREEEALAVVRDDGAIFTDAALPGAQPLAKLGMRVVLPETPPVDRRWSGPGVRRYLGGERPDPADAFHRVAGVVDAFMDFSRSLAPQETMCELVACYVFVTYLLDAVNVVGYLWPNGDRGAGKTTFLLVVAGAAYLGQVILAGGTYATLRDLADYGATLAFDDCEAIMDPKKADPDKRTLLLAGNRRGASVPFKEPAGPRGWVTRYVSTFCPRLFSAIRLPDAVLGSRTITVPLLRSTDPARAKAEPVDYSAWPTDRRRLIDDLWAIGLLGLPGLPPFDAEAASRARLSGRDLEPWRAILGVALWLQEVHGVSGLFDRMEGLSVSYQEDRSDLEASDPTRLAIVALQAMCRDAESDGSAMIFDTTTLTDRINALAVEEEVATDGEPLVNTRRVGRLLERLRFQKAERTARRKRWKTTAAEVEALARSYGIGITTNAAVTPQHGTNGRHGNLAHPELGAAVEVAAPAAEWGEP